MSAGKPGKPADSTAGTRFPSYVGERIDVELPAPANRRAPTAGAPGKPKRPAGGRGK
jgi:hypothetical protein